MKDRGRRARSRCADQDLDQEQPAPTTLRNARKVPPIQPKNEAQKHYMQIIEQHVITFGIGPAGTGKTYVGAAMACDRLLQREIEQIVVVRPAVESGENLGFLPGKLAEKYDPFIQPFYQVFHERLGRSQTEALIKAERIVISPLAFMRGLTFKDCWVLFDEAQNATSTQMEMLLTRTGPRSKVIITGDPSQHDLTGFSGLTHALKVVEGVRKIGVARFTSADVVRDGIVQEIVEAYERSRI